MKAIPESLCVEDVGQWLHGGWFLFKSSEEGTLIPGRLVREYDDNDGEILYIRDLDDGLFPLKRKWTFPFWPACGAVNLEGYAVHIARTQMRMYRRTYNDQCTTVHIPSKWDVMKAHGSRVCNVTPASPSVIKAVFSPRYYSYEEAVRMMDKGEAVSVALTPYIIVTEDMVYYRNRLIASIKDGKLVPIGGPIRQLGRIIKFFGGRVRL